jgi:4-amino-4-deoxy-L-arabinose transferase-like glycosyltransferase
VGQLLFAAAFAITATGLGWSLVKTLDSHQYLAGGERTVISFALGCTVISLLVLAVGIVRLDVVSMAVLASACIAAAVPGLRAIPWRSLKETTAAEWSKSRRDPRRAALWTTLIVIVAAGLIQGLAPPNDYDSLLYHLRLPKLDVEAGRMVFAWEWPLPQSGFPALGGNLTRLSLALVGEGAAQIIHGLFAIAAASVVTFVARRLGTSIEVALLAAIFFLAIRLVVWQMATVETDVLMSVYALLALLLYSAWRERGGRALALLLGVMLGSCIYAKYSGFAVALAFVPLIFCDLLIRRRSWSEMTVAVASAVLIILPHAARMYAETGNPTFPLFATLFDRTMVNLIDSASDLGTGRSVWDLLTAPWNFSVRPLHHFDGMMLGAPYLLAFAPLALLSRDKRGWGPLLGVAAIYYAEWFWLLSQQVRFLLPSLGVVCVFAAIGCGALWKVTAARPMLRTVFLLAVGALAINQSMFVGIYGLLRLPVALNLVDPTTYHARTPTMNGAHYETCRHVANNLAPGERFFSIAAAYNSYYCPQAAAVHKFFPDEAKWWFKSPTPPPMALPDFVARFEKARFRFVFMSKAIESRRDYVGGADHYRANENVVAQSRPVAVDASSDRLGAYLYPVFAQLRPLVEDPYTAVYDGADVLAGLKRQLEHSDRR